MAKTKMAMLTVKASEQKAQFDSVVAQLVAVREQRLALEKTEAELKAIVEERFNLDPTQKEVVKGNEYYAEKRPSKRNVAYTLGGLEAIVDAAVQNGADLTLDQVATARTVYDVDKKLVAALVKDGFVAQSVVDGAYTCDWTYSTHVGKL